ncbi:hypothetical protein LTR62_005305 [Meristemomyces frigidus]|uniref:Septin-type G domain-containing protein n=1 Tax=Meristemomyces frigidus TaxID=1508187 RepID=A0AAN7YQX9_9PEZI|nr:hypothetical protein LTR62_005305 [Meristemomyces frigidus]
MSYDTMSTSKDYDARTIRGKQPAIHPPPPSTSPGKSGPTTFFLRSEKEIERSGQRGRKASRSNSTDQEEQAKIPPASSMADSSFGVESLADTISSGFPSESSLSRTNSTDSAGLGAGAESNIVSSRKRKAGNPVSARINATGQRIISAERAPIQQSSSRSPQSLRSAESPLRSQAHLRRGSATSSINLNSQPLTPLRMSPQPHSATPSTPRSASPKSFRLSDEECSVADETGSQAVQSSSGDDEDLEIMALDKSNVSSIPQLVMPSIAIPARRQFTERGKRIGRLKIMIVGQSGSGKTSLIQSFFRVCEDIVHVDSAVGSTLSSSRRNGLAILETHASTRTYPSWRTQFEGKRHSHRRTSTGDGVLERNLCFIDTPGLSEEGAAMEVLDYLNKTIAHTTDLEKMQDSELVNILGGDGGTQIDVVLWLFDTAPLAKSAVLLDGKQKLLFQSLCKCTNLIPLLARADEQDAAATEVCRQQVQQAVEEMGVEVYDPTRFDGLSQDAHLESPSIPFAISSALSDDTETIDASILMSSQYLQPLVPSELNHLVAHLLHPENIARMRHRSATKVLFWRQAHLAPHATTSQQQQHHDNSFSPQFGHTLRSVPSTNSVLAEEASKVLLPPSTANHYRSISPSTSARSSLQSGGAGEIMTASATSANALAQYNNEQTQAHGSHLPFRQIRLAKWAQDLQRSLDNERRRYREMYLHSRPSQRSSTDGADESAASATGDAETFLIPYSQRPAKGRLGGAIAVIDPRDPLGVLGFSQACRRHGWFALKVASGCGVLGALVWWTMRHWAEVQEWWGGPNTTLKGGGLRYLGPAPAGLGVMGWVEEVDWRGFFGWGR